MSAGLGTEHVAQVRADIVEGETDAVVGEPTPFVVEVTNLGSVIRMFRVSVLGIDDSQVSFDPPVVALFPGEREQVTATITLPAGHPAGRRVLVFEVVDARADDPVPALVDFAVDVHGRPSLTLSVEPATLEAGSKGTFVVHVVNTGNTELDVDLVAQDEERLVDVTFEPERPKIQPGGRAVVRAMAKGPRPWFGVPAVRVLDVSATCGEASAVSAMALLQRARIGRRLISFLGLLLVVTLFAYVILISFGRVAELSEQNAALVQQGLGFEDDVADRASPIPIGGAVKSSTGAGISGATVRLFAEDAPDQPLQTTVSIEDGQYSFGAVSDGKYLLQAEAAGFGLVWYPTASDIGDAVPLEIAGGELPADALDFVLSGRPGSVEGTVIGADVAGALVAVRLPVDSLPGPDLPGFEPVPAIVAAVPVDDTGQFVLPDLTTPATYEIAVSKRGFATELRTITLKAGEERGNVEILLRRGAGRITGTVVDTAGRPISGADIRATDGTSEALTRSLSEDSVVAAGSGDASTDAAAVAGTFELRDLVTPGTYTITVTAPGFFTETLTLTLADEEQVSGRRIIMVRDTGSIGGTVRGTDGSGLGGVTVTVVGAGVELSTQSLTRAVGADQAIGAWFVDALPVPGTYTISFNADGFRTTAVTVELLPGAEAARSGVDAVLTQATARVSGLVKDASGAEIPGVEVTLEGSEVKRETVTSNFPEGKYVFDRVPAGVYTLTYRRAGSTPQTLLVDLEPGADVTLDDVVLEAQARITGTVRRDGVATSDIGVVVYRARDYPEGEVASTVTVANGRFEIVGLDAPDTYILDFQVPAGGQVAESREVFVQPDSVTDLEVDL